MTEQRRCDVTCKWFPAVKLHREMRLGSQALFTSSQALDGCRGLLRYLSALTFCDMHLHLHESTVSARHATVKAKASTTASTALTSPIFASLYVKADKKEQAASRSRLFPSTEWGGSSLVLQQRGPLRFPRSNVKT